MKIKIDFITNSSSNCYVILDAPDNIIKNMMDMIEDLNESELVCNSCYGINFENSIEKLNSYTQGRPWDWVSKTRGLKFYNLSEDEYERLLVFIKEGKQVMLVKLDNNISHHFHDRYDKYISEYLYDD